MEILSERLRPRDRLRLLAARPRDRPPLKNFLLSRTLRSLEHRAVQDLRNAICSVWVNREGEGVF